MNAHEAGFCLNRNNLFQPTPPRIFLENALVDALGSLPAQSGKCLNIGCGTKGRYWELLAGFDVDGVDILPEPPGGITRWRYHQCDAAHLPFSDNYFDFVLAVECFEHIQNNVSAMQEVQRVLRAGGTLIITTPTHWTWPFQFGRHGPHYYTLPRLEELIREAGLKIHVSRACGGALYWLTSLVKSWLSLFGNRLLGQRWWPLIDGVLSPVYKLAYRVDRVLKFFPTNWLVVAKKSENE
jgi:SAM-dependent methyltransferase